MKNTTTVSLGTVHAHGVLTDKKVKIRINKIEKDSKNLVLKNDTG